MASIESRLYAFVGWLSKLRRQTAPALPAMPPRKNEPSDEERLTTYLRRIGVLDERPDKADAAALAALSRIWQSGQKSVATRLGGALAAALPTDADLQLLVADLLMRQQLYDTARPLLQRVLAPAAAAADSDSSAQRLRARWLLHEVAAAAGQHMRASEELAQLLAEDWNYPGARERLRAQQALVAGSSSTKGAEKELFGDGVPELPLQMALLPATAGAALFGAATLLGGEPVAAARYELKRELGSGGSGAVYLATDKELGCEVALKLFFPRHSRQKADGQPVESPAEVFVDDRALHEARLLCSLRHPGVLFLYEMDPQGRYLTMELCEGGSLRARLHGGPLSAEQALWRGLELCETLRAVHELGVVHGDLKPENLLFRSPARSLRAAPVDPLYGDLVVSDFGVARRLAEEKASAPAAGTLSYLAPERLHGAPPSPAADMYSFGMIMKELTAPTLQAAPYGELAQLVGWLLSADAAARPDATAALDRLRKQAGSFTELP